MVTSQQVVEPPATANDDDLLARWVRAKDDLAFTELARRHADLVYATCRRIVQDHHTAAEVTQDCLLEFARKAESVRTSVAGFLHAMATTRARNRVRDDVRRWRRQIRAAGPVIEDAAGLDRTWGDLAPQLDQALAELPEEERLPLIRHFLQGRSQVQVAEELGCGQASVSRRIASGLENLRERLARVGIVASTAVLSASLTANAAEKAPAAVLSSLGQAAWVGASNISAAVGGASGSKIGGAVVAAFLLAIAGLSSYLVFKPAPPMASNAPLTPTSAPASAARWSRGIPTDANFFPIGVWLQSPTHADAYAKAGINLYFGLWDGLQEADLAALSHSGMRLICEPDEVALRHLEEPTIVGWFTAGNPDSAGQSDGHGGIRAQIDPAELIRAYDDVRAKDPTRPVCVLFDAGASWDDYPERGARRGHPEDYVEYSRGADLLAFETFPVNNQWSPERGDLRSVAHGVDKLRAASARGGQRKPVWPWIECTRIHDYSPAKPTPEQVRAEIWMSLVHGATGFVYFCHALTSPKEDAAALLHDPLMLAAVTDINRQVRELAPVLNSPTIADGVTITSSDPDVSVDAMVKRLDGVTYVFAVAMREGTTTATFRLSQPAGTVVEVIGENRTLPNGGGMFSDGFSGCGVHLYQLRDSP